MNSLIGFNFNKIKKVGIRVDFNVPVDENFIITDDTRLLRAKETINFIKKKKLKILLISHFGRPKNSFDKKFSFENLINQFSEILDLNINLITYENFKSHGLSNFEQFKNQINLLDNIRFFEGEKTDDKFFSKSITDHLDLYVNEAFSASHRGHSSVNQMVRDISSVPGLNFEKEVKIINEIKNSSQKKLAIIGGSKVSTKLNTLISLTASCSNIFIGGAMANNFLKFKGFPIGSSLFEKGSEEMIEQIYRSSSESGCEIHLPLDVVLDNKNKMTIEKLTSSSDFKIFDISDQSLQLLERLIHKSETILWNGPMGMIENHNFAIGSTSLANILANSSNKVVIGGGDTLLAINIAGINFNKYHFVSTAGGAFLEALEDKVLPGIAALNQG